MKLKDTRVLVTGGTGFAGSHLVEELLNKGVEVVSTFHTLQPRSYFAHKKLEKKVILAQTDINDFTAVQHLVTKFKIEFIFHLAAQPLVEVAYYHPHQTLMTNIMGTVNLLECARLYPFINGIIVASSDKAYGKLSKEKYDETTPLQGDHPYDVSKSAADLITTMYVKTYQVPSLVTRFGNIYGEGDLNFSRIIPGIMKSLITGEKLILRSSGLYVRDYLHVRDVATGYISLAEHSEEMKHTAYNFGSRETYSVVKLIEVIENVLGKKIKYEINDTAKNEIPYQSLDYSRIKNEIGWEPTLTLEASLEGILAYYSSILKNNG